MPTTASNPSEQRGRLLAGPFKQRVVAQELKINSLNFYENTEPQGGLSIQSPRGWSPMRLYRSRSPEPFAFAEGKYVGGIIDTGRIITSQRRCFRPKLLMPIRTRHHASDSSPQSLVDDFFQAHLP